MHAPAARARPPAPRLRACRQAHARQLSWHLPESSIHASSSCCASTGSSTTGAVSLGSGGVWLRRRSALSRADVAAVSSSDPPAASSRCVSTLQAQTHSPWLVRRNSTFEGCTACTVQPVVAADHCQAKPQATLTAAGAAPTCKRRCHPSQGAARCRRRSSSCRPRPGRTPAMARPPPPPAAVPPAPPAAGRQQQPQCQVMRAPGNRQRPLCTRTTQASRPTPGGQQRPTCFSRM